MHLPENLDIFSADNFDDDFPFPKVGYITVVRWRDTQIESLVIVVSIVVEQVSQNHLPMCLSHTVSVPYVKKILGRK